MSSPFLRVVPEGAPSTCYAVESPTGVRVWHADDEQHAIWQHFDCFPGDPTESPVMDVYKVEHPDDCACRA